jgi:N-acyl-D-aspartate/D-glutamate deacylase
MKRILVLASILIFSCSSDPQNCDILIENGIIYDGTGDKPYKGVVAISNDKIIYVGKNKNFVADKVIDATDKAVSPGFINMLSWAYNSLMDDGRSLNDLKQGVTLEIFW